MKQVLGIRDEKARMKVTPPLPVAPLAQEVVMFVLFHACLSLSVRALLVRVRV